MTPRVEFSSSDSPFSVGLQAAALVACGREAPPTWEQPLPGPGQSHAAERVQCGQGHRQLAFLFSFFFLAVLHSLGILVPQPGIEPGPSAVKAVSLNHWTSRGVPGFFVSILFSVFQIFTECVQGFKKEMWSPPRSGEPHTPECGVRWLGQGYCPLLAAGL